MVFQWGELEYVDNTTLSRARDEGKLKMSIKSDNWIIEQAEKNQLIDPFEANQVREVDGNKIVSYGVSSYGYDVAVPMNSKFYQYFSSVVDPKNFDSNGFVDVILQMNALSRQIHLLWHVLLNILRSQDQF